MPGEGPADHPASHWGGASDAGAHQLGHTWEERASLEERGCPGVRQYPLGIPANLAYILRLLCPWVPQATGSPSLARRAPLPIGWSDSALRALLGAE